MHTQQAASLSAPEAEAKGAAALTRPGDIGAAETALGKHSVDVEVQRPPDHRTLEVVEAEDNFANVERSFNLALPTAFHKALRVREKCCSSHFQNCHFFCYLSCDQAIFMKKSLFELTISTNVQNHSISNFICEQKINEIVFC